MLRFMQKTLEMEHGDKCSEHEILMGGFILYFHILKIPCLIWLWNYWCIKMKLESRVPEKEMHIKQAEE